MSYLGNAPARSFISFERQVFTIVNSQTAYALSHSVTNENDIRLVVNNVVQEPGSGKAYTATGTALTLSAALTNGTDEMYCVFLGRATATSAPGAGSIGTAQLASDAVTLAKMAPGTDGNIISYDASGNPVAVATGNDGQVLTSAGAGAPPVFESPASAVNTPAFHSTLSSNQAIANNSNVKVTFNNEVYDSDGTFASNKFTPGVAGKYILSVCLMIDGDSNTTVSTSRLFFYKNGSSIQFIETSSAANPGRIHAPSASLLVDSDADDYFEVYAYISTSGSGQFVQGGTAGSFFSGYKLIT